jgi:muconolactone delta-isomerase
MGKLFMAAFDLPAYFSEEFIQLIPAQRAYINYLLAEGKVKSYSLSMDRSKLWVVFVSEDESELMGMIEDMPLFDFMDPEISELMFHNAQDRVLQFSLN